MLRRRLFALTCLLTACGSSTPPAESPTAASAAPSASPPPSAAASGAPSPAPSSAASAAPAQTPEEKKKAEDARNLLEDRAKWNADVKVELARWTPELHAQAKAIADKTYPSGKAALEAAMKGPQRRPADALRDKYRHPAETLAFFGFKPTMKVLDVNPGDGWYTEILAPALAKQGQYFATSGNPNGSPDDRSTFGAEKFRAFLDSAPEAYGKAQTIVVDSKAPQLPADGSFDMVLLMREAHGMVNAGTLNAWLSAIHGALRSGGVLGIEEHRAPKDADPIASSKKGYVPEKWLKEQVEAAGFKLAGESPVNDNSKDTKDYPEGVWTLPPTLRLGDKDRDKYLAIGESDRMTLKFVKK